MGYTITCNALADQSVVSRAHTFNDKHFIINGPHKDTPNGEEAAQHCLVLRGTPRADVNTIVLNAFLRIHIKHVSVCELNRREVSVLIFFRVVVPFDEPFGALLGVFTHVSVYFNALRWLGGSGACTHSGDVKDTYTRVHGGRKGAVGQRVRYCTMVDCLAAGEHSDDSGEVTCARPYVEEPLSRLHIQGLQNRGVDVWLWMFTV